MDWIAMATHYTSYGPRLSYITGMARAFARRAPTVYVNQPMGWYQAWVKREPTGVIEDLDPPGVRVFQPYTWWSPRTQENRRKSMRFVGRRLKSILSGSGLFWLHVAEHLEMTRPFEDAAVVCSFGDGGEAGEPERMRMLSEADYILPISVPLFESCLTYFPDKTYFLPCGVDTTQYDQAPDVGDSVESGWIAELTRRGSPVVLCYGGVNDRINFSLLYYLADRLRDLEFVVAGPIEVAFKAPHLRRCLTRKNIAFTDALSLAEYHALLRLSAVGIVPYEIQDTTAYANPLKLYDYWCFGKPVVSSYVSTYRVFGDLLFLSEGFEDFAESLERAVVESDQEKARLRKAIARLHDPQNLAAAVLSIVDQDHALAPDFFLQRIRTTLGNQRIPMTA